MAATESQMKALNTLATPFNLLNTLNGEIISLDKLKSTKATVILFICNHCPFVIHINEALVKLANEFQVQGVSFIAISSNDIKKYPADAPELMTEFAKKNGFTFPYLYDEDQSIAKAYGAECTPDLFVYNSEMKLAYRGRFDETRPNMGTATGRDLSQALDSIIETNSFNEEQLPSIGCGIKWK